jgi:integrase/recombinase XerD
LKPTAPTDPHASLIARYRHHLSEVRGLAPDTIEGNLWEVGAFLRRALPRGESVASISPNTIEQYIQRRASTVARRTLRHTVDVLRDFLRYCFDQRLLTKRLDVIERPLGFRDELPPRALKWPLIRKLLRSINRNDRAGWRDFMLLHLMAHYGLRNGEIVRLTLESIDWSAQTLLVEQSKTNSWLKLPLLKQTAPLLQRYVDEHRPVNHDRHLFQNALAPYGPMTKFSVSQVFKIRARDSGLPIAHASAYCLRHSFAMRLFARGVGIKAIGDLMGHNNLVSTAVYLRLQTDMLREVALPVPAMPKAARNAA